MPQSAATQFSGIFVSYRRDDSAGHAGRLFDRLSEHFGRERLFMDVDHIEPGEDFVQVIEAAVGSSAVLLVVIGRRWLTSGDMTARRLDNPNDFVRLEVASALASNVRVIPVLVQDATMPGPQDLPDDLVRLSRLNAIELSDLRWNRDVDQLISVLERFFSKQQEAQRMAEQEAEKERQREAEAQRQTEDEQRRQQNEQAALATEEERRREKAEEAEQRKREMEEIESRRVTGPLPATAEGTSLPPRPDVSPLSVEPATVLPSYGTEGPNKLRLMIAGAALVVFAIALAVWLAPGPKSENTSPGVNQTQQRQGQPQANVRLTENASPGVGQQQAGSNAQRIDLVLIPVGSFMMGSTNGFADEKPVHRVTIREAFYMGKYEVTQAQWQKVMGKNPSVFEGDNLPVDYVSWDDAQEFLGKLNGQNDGYTYRLPSEAEWEYAARAGTTTEFAFGDSLSPTQANFDGNHPYGGAATGDYREKTMPVGSFQPNAFGLYDMHGNVSEWCQDWYHTSYSGAPTDGRVWQSGAKQKYPVLRGGSWYSRGEYLSSAYRSREFPGLRVSLIGFRVAATART